MPGLHHSIVFLLSAFSLAWFEAIGSIGHAVVCHGIEYLQISWLRAMALFGSHKINPDESKVNDPADAFEFQGMGRVGSLGTSRLKATWYAPSSFTYGDLGQTEEWEGAYVHWIHRADLSESTPLFLEFTLDTAKEELRTDEPDVRKDEYKGERDYYQFRLETHLNLKAETAELSSPSKAVCAAACCEWVSKPLSVT